MSIKASDIPADLRRIEFHVDGEPKAQPRARAAVVNGHARVYDPGTAEGWKSRILAAVAPQRPAEPWTGAVSMTVVFKMPRPNNHYGTGRNLGVLKSSAPRQHIKKPDLDNLVKAVKDCLTRIVWRDDAQVCDEILTKRYTHPGEAEGATIIIRQRKD